MVCLCSEPIADCLAAALRELGYSLEEFETLFLMEKIKDGIVTSAFAKEICQEN